MNRLSLLLLATSLLLALPAQADISKLDDDTLDVVDTIPIPPSPKPAAPAPSPTPTPKPTPPPSPVTPPVPTQPMCPVIYSTLEERDSTMFIQSPQKLAILFMALVSSHPLGASGNTPPADADDNPLCTAREVLPPELIQYPPAEKKRILEWVYAQAAQLPKLWFVVEPKTQLRFDYGWVDRVVLSDALAGREIPEDAMERVVLAVDKNYPCAEGNGVHHVARELVIALRFCPDGEVRLKKLLAQVNTIQVKALLIRNLIGALSDEEIEKLPKPPPDYQKHPEGVEQWVAYARALEAHARDKEARKEITAMSFNEKLDHIIEGGEFFGWEVTSYENSELTDAPVPSNTVAVFSGWTPYAIFKSDNCGPETISNFFTLRALFKTHRQEVLAYLNRTDIELCKGRTPREIQAVRSCVLHLLGEKTKPIPGDPHAWEKNKKAGTPATPEAEKKDTISSPASVTTP